AATAEALFRQAYGGQARLTVTAPRTRRLSGAEQEYIRYHAQNFTPSTRAERSREALEAYQDTTILVPGQLAAYVSPLAFEEGISITVQERIPPFAFDPTLEGDVVLGHQWSTERGTLTKVPLRLSRERHMHTLFSADTRFGKSIAAERLALETTKAWKTRTVVFDFGMGWRRMINAPIPPERVEVLQLYPNAPVPLCFNPWQVPRRIEAANLLTANCELFKNAGRMGPKQYGYMLRTAEAMYQDAGVLTADPRVLNSATWGQVRDRDEEHAINAVRQLAGLPLARLVGKELDGLLPLERQALATHRSKAVGMAEWVERLRKLQKSYEKRNEAMNSQSADAIVTRLEPFTRGEMARMYGKGDSVVTVEDLGILGPPDDQWGMTVIEGGAEMTDNYIKASLIGLIAWRLYTDSIVRRRENIGLFRDQLLQIVFEEANKVFTGVADGEDQSPSAATSQLYLDMFRDGARYLTIYYIILQSMNEMHSAMISSCSNAWLSQLKSPKDRDLGVAHLSYSEKGFTDEDYKRFISRIPQAMFITRLALSQDVVKTMPYLVRPVMVPGLEPTDHEILIHHQNLEQHRARWKQAWGGIVA
ncbi:MAG: hypothetical protein JW910_12135, partial [Anaerolineae bacterium]|nr:hypothetical protein [Anaerolineae bacterium]